MEAGESELLSLFYPELHLLSSLRRQTGLLATAKDVNPSAGIKMLVTLLIPLVRLFPNSVASDVSTSLAFAICA